MRYPELINPRKWMVSEKKDEEIWKPTPWIFGISHGYLYDPSERDTGIKADDRFQLRVSPFF